MNALVVYDSQYGNTARIAAVIGDTLRTTGDLRSIRVDEAQPIDLEGVDLLILGSPTQGWAPTKAMQAFIASLSPEQLRGRTVACFDTRFQKPRWLTGSAARVMANRLQKLGVELVVAPESYFVERSEGPLVAGERGRAAVWARIILDKVGVPQPAAQR